jgi:uncharacterized Zn-binding protein involved in type VI secretion
MRRPGLEQNTVSADIRYNRQGRTSTMRNSTPATRTATTSCASGSATFTVSGAQIYRTGRDQLHRARLAARISKTNSPGENTGIICGSSRTAHLQRLLRRPAGGTFTATNYPFAAGSRSARAPPNSASGTAERLLLRG